MKRRKRATWREAAAGGEEGEGVEEVREKRIGITEGDTEVEGAAGEVEGEEVHRRAIRMRRNCCRRILRRRAR